ncbi:hypothetical protein VKT23_008156 [Stygiomarasmius scandens]|uniref:Uncharacterized protein n=1 Tax=Marasmiellus scandens TaxID=2682957 RepID=A0ABR1JI15_9AGAR
MMPTTPSTPSKSLVKKQEINDSPASTISSFSATSKILASPSPSSVSPSRPRISIAQRLADQNLPVPPARTMTQTYTDPVLLPTECEVTNHNLQDRLLLGEGIGYHLLPPLRYGV